MPVVPRQDPNQVRETISNEPEQRIQAPLESFGGGQSVQRVAGASKELIEAGQKFKQRADDTLFLEAETKLSKYHTDSLMKIKALEGKNALEANQIMEGDWDIGTADIINEYQSEDVKRRIRMAAQARKMDLYKSGSSHIQKELMKYEDSVFTGFVTNTQNEITQDYTDPNRIKLGLKKLEFATRKKGNSEGLDEGDIKSKVDAIKSGTHLKLVSSMVNDKNDLLAKEYFNANRKEFVGQDLETAKKLVEAGSLKGEAIRMTDKYYDPTQKMTVVLDQVRGKISNAELEDEVVRRIKERYAEKRIADNMADEDRLDRMTNIIDEKGIDAISEEDWIQTDAKDKKWLRSYAKGSINTEWQTYYDLKDMALNPATRQAFMNANLMQYRGKLADSEFKEIVKMREAMKKGKDNILDGFRTETQIVTDAWAEAGRKTKSKKDKKELAQFRRKVDERVIQYQERSGKKANNDDVQRIANELMTKVVVNDPGWLWDSKEKKPAFSVKADEQIFLTIEDIPEKEISAMRAAAARKNMQITDELIVNAYKRKLRGLSAN